MSIVGKLAVLALKPVVEGLELGVSHETMEHVIGALQERLTDHSGLLLQAIQEASDRSWTTVHLALKGDSFWRRWLRNADERGYAQKIRYLFQTTLPKHLNQAECLREFEQAQERGLLKAKLNPSDLAREAGAFARYTNPAALLQAEQAKLRDLGADFAADYPHLAELVQTEVAPGQSVVVLAARYFLHLKINSDEKLAHTVHFAQLEKLHEDQEAAFAGLYDLFNEHHDEIAKSLEGLHEEVRQTHTTVVSGVAELKAEVQVLGDRMPADIVEKLLQALAELGILGRLLRPADASVAPSARHQGLLEKSRAQLLALPQEQRRLPILNAAIGKLAFLTGAREAALESFASAAAMAPDKPLQAELHYHAYLAALELGAWDRALAEIKHASSLEREHYQPFPFDKYQPLRILGAGGFGVAFQCRHAKSGGMRVVKVLHAEDLERPVEQLFAEANTLETLSNPAILRIYDCEFADERGRSRPYLVTEYFQGVTLESYVRDHIKQHKKGLPSEEMLAIARWLVSGLREAHAQGIVHRDLKPANILVRKEGATCKAKLIDWGLSLRHGLVPSTRDGGQSQSRVAVSVAGTLDYADRFSGKSAGPHSDIFSFGKTCYFALLGHHSPNFHRMMELDEPWRDLLSRCVAPDADERPKSFNEIERALFQPAPESTPPPPPSKLGVYASYDEKKHGKFEAAVDVSNNQGYLIWLENNVIDTTNFAFPTTILIKIKREDLFYRGVLEEIRTAEEFGRDALQAEEIHRPPEWRKRDENGGDFQCALFISGLKEVQRPKAIRKGWAPMRPCYPPEADLKS
jgi:serine/threonine protein kinase